MNKRIIVFLIEWTNKWATYFWMSALTEVYWLISVTKPSRSTLMANTFGILRDECKPQSFWYTQKQLAHLYNLYYSIEDWLFACRCINLRPWSFHALGSIQYSKEFANKIYVDILYFIFLVYYFQKTKKQK